MDVSDTASSASRKKLSESLRKISFHIRSDLPMTECVGQNRGTAPEYRERVRQPAE
jgi:hypothetical protein